MTSKNHNFILGPCDTDSISFSKEDQSPFTPEEQKSILDEINSIMPEFIQYSHDGYFARVIVLMAKNYVLYDPTAKKGKEVTYKGSAIKAKGKAPALQAMIKQFIDVLLFTPDDKHHEELLKIYNSLAKEIDNITDMKRWCSRKTISATTLSSERANETKIVDAIAGTDYVEGDRIYTYFKEDKTLGLLEHFDGKYDKVKLFKDLYTTTETFGAILPIKTLFMNYSLVKNQKKIKDLP